MKLVFTRPYDLYRYDLVAPPKTWSLKYRNREYVFNDTPEEMMKKNQVGAYFFYDDKSQAYLTGETGARKQGISELWLTHTKIIPNITLLDLRKHCSYLGYFIQHSTPLQIVNRLDEIGIDVLNDKYSKYLDCSGRKIPFSEVKSTYDKIIEIDNKENTSLQEDIIKINLANEFNTFFHNSIGYLGQLLTDFSNGIEFKQQLVLRGFDGYIFEEEIYFHKPTFCIFDSTHLENPITERIEL